MEAVMCMMYALISKELYLQTLITVIHCFVLPLPLLDPAASNRWASSPALTTPGQVAVAGKGWDKVSQSDALGAIPKEFLLLIYILSTFVAKRISSFKFRLPIVPSTQHVLYALLISCKIVSVRIFL